MMANPEFRLTPQERHEIDCLVEMLDNRQMCWELSVPAVAARCEALDVSFEVVLAALTTRGWRLDLFGWVLIKTASGPLKGDTGQGLPSAVSPPDHILDNLYGILPDPDLGGQKHGQ